MSLRLVTFDAKKIDSLERQNPVGVSDQSYVELWRGGEGQTLSSQNLKTLNGVNAIIEMVDEIIYPQATTI